MQRPRACRAAFASGLALLLGSTAFTLPTQALAQAAPAPAAPATAAVPAQSTVVQRIIVRGNERIEQSTVLSYLPIQPGETVDAERLDLALKTLFRTDLFADVQINTVGNDLIINVVENPIINRVIFEGNSGLKEDKLRDEVSVRPRGIFTRGKAQADVQRIVELYRKSGRISATVTPQIIELPQKRVDLIFKIDEGPKSGVLRVNFLGNKEFSDNDLRDVVVTEQTTWYKFFASNANYDPDRLEYDKEQLRKFYRNRGFYDFRVISAVAELASDKNGFVVTYTVDEGPEYKFGKISVETELQKLNKDVLQQLIPIRSGDLYEDEKIEQATDALTFAAGAAGFAFVDVTPDYKANRETKTIDLVFQVKEGPRVYIDRIDVVGNSQTLDYVIRREMNVAEGDAYNRALVDRSRSQIRALGFFKEVEITDIPGSAPDRTGLQVKVEEQPTGELSFSAGYSSVDQLVVDLGITERNFRGRGQNVRARVSVGSLQQQIEFSFYEPRFLGRNVGAGVDVYRSLSDFTDYSYYRLDAIGTGVRFAFPLTLNTIMTTRYTLRKDEVEASEGFCVPGQPTLRTICSQQGSFLTSLVGYGLRHDRRNDALNPTRGFYAAINQDFAGVGGDVKYIRSEVEGGWYHGFNKDFILSVTGEAGYIQGLGDDQVRLSDRFFKGGTSFRGFESAGIGPRDLNYPDNGALGGKAYAIGAVELTVPTFLPEQYGIKAAVFTQFGTLGQLDDKDKIGDNGLIDPNVRDDLSLRASAGISIFWKSPMGPIRLDFSQVLAKEDYDRTETFKFSTSTRFQ